MAGKAGQRHVYKKRLITYVSRWLRRMRRLYGYEFYPLLICSNEHISATIKPSLVQAFSPISTKLKHSKMWQFWGKLPEFPSKHKNFIPKLKVSENLLCLLTHKTREKACVACWKIMFALVVLWNATVGCTLIFARIICAVISCSNPPLPLSSIVKQGLTSTGKVFGVTMRWSFVLSTPPIPFSAWHHHQAYF